MNGGIVYGKSQHVLGKRVCAYTLQCRNTTKEHESWARLLKGLACAARCDYASIHAFRARHVPCTLCSAHVGRQSLSNVPQQPGRGGSQVHAGANTEGRAARKRDAPPGCRLGRGTARAPAPRPCRPWAPAANCSLQNRLRSVAGKWCCAAGRPSCKPSLNGLNVGTRACFSCSRSETHAACTPREVSGIHLHEPLRERLAPCVLEQARGWREFSRGDSGSTVRCSVASVIKLVTKTLHGAAHAHDWTFVHVRQHRAEQFMWSTS